MIELRHLRHLRALAEHGNFGRAAEAVHITQSALTRSIQSLETIVGASLFDRSRNGIEPTEIGRLLLQHAQAFHSISRDLAQELRLAKGLELSELRIGVGPFGGSALIGPVIGRLNQLHPRLRIRLVVAPWQELPERARARDVDLVVAELSEIRELDDFALEALSVHVASVVSRVGHPITKLPNPKPRDVFTYPLAGPRMPLHAVRPLVNAAPPDGRDALLRAGLLTIECDSSTILKNILLESDAVSMMPGFMVQTEERAGHLAVLSGIDLGIRTQFGAAWLRHRSLSGAGLKFVELLRSHDAALTTDAPPPLTVNAGAAPGNANPRSRPRR